MRDVSRDEQRDVLHQYLATGHVVLDGYLAATAVSVVVPPYAEARMRQRDIDEAELIAVLSTCRSSHGKGKTEGRFEVAAITDRGRVRVIYERPSPQIVVVITAYPEQI
jgi:hypothetical protein